MKTLALTAAVLTACVACPSSACELCAIYSASQARGEVGQGPFLGVAEQFTHYGTLQSEGSEVPNPTGQYLDSSVSQVLAGYNINNHVGLQLNLPVIYRDFKRPDGLGGIDRGNESGIGDLALLANVAAYRVLKEKFTFSCMLLGGVKFPTGSSSRLKEEFSEVENPTGPASGIHGHDLTLGSGSYDGIIGTTLYGRWGRAFMTASAQYAIRSEGAYEYRFANDVTWSAGPGFYLVLGHSYTLGLQAVVSGEDKGTDTLQGVSAPDTGITAVYLGPGLTFTWGSNLSAEFNVDLPVLRDNTALQVVPDYRVRAAVTWRF